MSTPVGPTPAGAPGLEPTEDDPDLAGLAMAITGDRATAAALLGEVSLGRVRAGGPGGGRSLLAASALRRRPPSPAPARRESLPDELEEVARRLGLLPTLARVAIAYTQLCGLTLAETAGLLDRPTGVVGRAVHDALDQLDTDPYALAATLRTLSWQPPGADEVRRARARAEQRRRGHRRRLGVVVAAAVLLLVAAVVVPLSRVQPALYTRGAGEWAYGFTLTPEPGWRLTSHIVSTDLETSSVVADSTGSGGAIGCTVSAGLPGSSLAADASRPAWFAQTPILGRPAVTVPQGVRWWPGAGVVVQTICTNGADAAATARRVTATLRFGNLPVLLPFVLDMLPPGATVRNVGTQFGRARVALDSTPPTQREEDSLTVTLYREGDDAGYTLHGEPEVDHDVWTFLDGPDGTQACRFLQQQHLCVEDPTTRSDGQDMGSAAGYGLLLRVVDHLRAATSAVDESTWFDARDAVPR